VDTAAPLSRPVDVTALSRAEVDRYDGFYLCGGHGAMADLPHDPGVTRVLRWFLGSGRPIAAVCHGPAALLPLRDGDGAWPLAGYRMTAFSHEEEMATEMAGALPFVLQVELERLGAKYERATAAWDECVVTDRNLTTGQNPHSSRGLAAAFTARLAAAG